MYLFRSSFAFRCCCKTIKLPCSFVIISQISNSDRYIYVVAFVPSVSSRNKFLPLKRAEKYFFRKAELVEKVKRDNET